MTGYFYNFIFCLIHHLLKISPLLERLHFQYSILICLISFLVPAINAQDQEETREEFYQIREHFDRSYGSDYNLLNGRKYYLPYSSVSHPFLNSDQYRPGSLLIKGKRYFGVLINYDIYQQQVILQYINYLGQVEQLILTAETID